VPAQKGWAMADARPTTYTPTARFLHWLTAAIVLVIIPMGIVMANMELGKLGDVLFDLHRSLGFVLLPLAIWRVWFRLTHPVPALPPDIPGYQVLAAEATHWALYALLLAQPIIGWIANSAYGAPLNFFWLFDLPPIWAKNEPLSDTMFALHRWLGFLMAAILLAHIGAAFFHHFVRKDNILTRMVRG
jgi:cytochrome b561